MFHALRRPDIMVVTLAAAGLLMVTMGLRQSFGLFISPINGATGMGIATISLALAIGQFTWGAIQPVLNAATAAVSRASTMALPMMKRWLKPTACITVISLSAYKRP